ncbi:MAG: HAMP domain-containing protein [Proteobacteria bacterium]|nr:HAMP domain-containing protein [Pseudomonadota bacterium]
MTLRARLAVFFGLISLVLLSTFSFLIYSRVKENALKGAESYLRELSKHEWEHLELPSHQSSQHEETSHYRNVYLRIWKENHLIYDSFPKGEPVRVQAQGLDVKQGKLFNTLEGLYQGKVYKVTGFYDVSLILEHLAIFQRTLMLGCLASLLLIIPLSLFFTKFLLRPFTELAKQTSTLTAEDLAFRLPVPRKKDEYGILIENFNSLFDRLEKSFTQVKNFAVNASHEIRTPLSVVISQSERAVRRPPEDVKACVEVFQKLLQSALNLRGIINRLFVLSEVERIGQEITKTEFAVGETLDKVVADLQESYRNENRVIRVDPVPRDWMLKENKELFLSTVTNLLENALKYSKENVVLRFLKNSKGSALIIEDDGPGIPEEKRATVFEPFYRGEAASGIHSASHGLGLSIVKACVEAQKAKIELGSSSLGGLRVEISYPL